MSRSYRNHSLRPFLVAAILMALGLGCSTDSPTAPQQQPPGAPSPPSATWVITISVEPNELVAGSNNPAVVTVRVRRATDGANPPSGTTLVLSSSLGDFGSLDSGQSSAVLGLIAGRGEALLFPGSISGNALLTAQLEGSVGQRNLQIVPQIEEIVASFNFQNTGSDFSVAFQNTSTGNPTQFQWDFGDGGSSTEENPTHIFPGPGDFVVVLTASKPGSSARTSQLVAVSELEPVDASFEAVVDGLTVVFRDTSSGEPSRWTWNFGDGSTSRQQNPTHTYREQGTYVVLLRASRADGTSGEASQTITVNQNVFIRQIVPSSGPPSGGTSVTIRGQGFAPGLRVFFGSKLGTVVSVNSATIVVTTPPVTLPSEECDTNNDGFLDGVRTLDLQVDVRVDLASGASEVIPGGFTYVSPTGTACN